MTQLLNIKDPNSQPLFCTQLSDTVQRVVLTPGVASSFGVPANVKLALINSTSDIYVSYNANTPTVPVNTTVATGIGQLNPGNIDLGYQYGSETPITAINVISSTAAAVTIAYYT